MNPCDYPHRRFPFAEWNPAQEAALPHLDQDVNLVLALNTASGKTALAEAVFAFHLRQDQACKALYASPLRAVSAQKFAAWQVDEQFGPQGVIANTGDFTAAPADFEQARLIVTTFETLDSKARRAAHAGWLKRLAVLVIDEAHTIGTSRGPAVEAAMLRVSALNPKARLVLLSATMSNALELARWVKSLNGKPTRVVTSSWRPCPLDISICTAKGSEAETAAKVAAAGHGAKTLVFVHTRRAGQRLLKLLRQRRVSCGFHHAALGANKRHELEAAFSDESSGLDVLISTSTLGSGVNV